MFVFYPYRLIRSISQHFEINSQQKKYEFLHQFWHYFLKNSSRYICVRQTNGNYGISLNIGYWSKWNGKVVHRRFDHHRNGWQHKNSFGTQQTERLREKWQRCRQNYRYHLQR